MKKVLNIVAVLAAVALLAVMSVSAYVPSWTVNKDVVVTGDYKWNGASWTLPSPAPTTATYSFDAQGIGMNVDYIEAETMGSAWKYDFHNKLTTDGSGTINSFADITTVNDPRTTPATAFTNYAFGTQNDGVYSHSTIVVSGNGFATIDHSATFNSAFTTQNFVCVNNCV